MHSILPIYPKFLLFDFWKQREFSNGGMLVPHFRASQSTTHNGACAQKPTVKIELPILFILGCLSVFHFLSPCFFLLFNSSLSLYSTMMCDHTTSLIFLHPHLHTHTLSHTHSHTHTLTHSHAHTCTHTHTHTHTQAGAPLPLTTLTGNPSRAGPRSPTP